jgi:dTDP-4-dehydrorhamnose 3,5-epimerase
VVAPRSRKPCPDRRDGDPAAREPVDRVETIAVGGVARLRDASVRAAVGVILRRRSRPFRCRSKKSGAQPRRVTVRTACSRTTRRGGFSTGRVSSLMKDLGELSQAGRSMEVIETAIPAVKRLVPKRYSDSRGFFVETWNARRMAEIGLDAVFVQDNFSYSAKARTVRGLHVQHPPGAQGKLVRVARGSVLDVAVDVRRGSPSYGKWVAEVLSRENGAMLWVPRGFLHGFATLEPDTDVIYKVDAFHAPECEGAVRFDDPDLSIDWGIEPATAVLSARDAAAPAFRDFETPFVYDGRP